MAGQRAAARHAGRPCRTCLPRQAQAVSALALPTVVSSGLKRARQRVRSPIASDLRRRHRRRKLHSRRQGRTNEEQLRRFMGSGGSRKIRYARLLVEALDLTQVPRPLVTWYLLTSQPQRPEARDRGGAVAFWRKYDTGVRTPLRFQRAWTSSQPARSTETR
jgi:hypothetical protein